MFWVTILHKSLVPCIYHNTSVCCSLRRRLISGYRFRVNKKWFGIYAYLLHVVAHIFCRRVRTASSAKWIGYGHYIDHHQHMASERWKDDIAYAMNYVKLISWPIGVWPLQVYNNFSIIRCLWGIFSAVRISSVRYRCSFMFDRSRM